MCFKALFGKQADTNAWPGLPLCEYIGLYAPWVLLILLFPANLNIAGQIAPAAVNAKASPAARLDGRFTGHNAAGDGAAAAY